MAFSFFGRGASALLALALALPPTFAAQAEKQPNSPSEKAGEAFGKLGPLMKAQDYAGMLKILDAIPNPTLYDQHLIADMRAKVYLQLEQYGKAIEPWETALKLSDQHDYYNERDELQTVNLLARLVYSEAVAIKDKALQTQMVDKAAAYLKRFMESSKKPTAEDIQFYAQLTYARATSTEPINMAMLREGRNAIEQGMLMTIDPKESYYQLLVAFVLQENDYKKSAELLELVVQKMPQKKDYWPQLMVAYIQLATAEKDPEKARPYYIRAINTVERAQTLGFMNDQKTNYNLVTFYITIGQFSKATEVLHAGLRSGAIESTVANWRILGQYYQEANKVPQAIQSLEEASKLFPKDGMLDLHLGEIYRSQEKTREARDAYRRAVSKKETLAQPHIAFQLLAFAEMELENIEGALQAITEASKYPEFEKDTQMKNFKKHIEDTLRDRQQAEEQKKAAAKKV